MPSVSISPRVTPDAIFERTGRILPPKLDVRVDWPTRDSLHAIASGQSLNINQFTAWAALALHKDKEIAKRLNEELSYKYEDAKARGVLIMTEQTNSGAPWKLAAERLLAEKEVKLLVLERTRRPEACAGLGNGWLYQPARVTRYRIGLKRAPGLCLAPPQRAPPGSRLTRPKLPGCRNPLNWKR